jgi:putative YphP/YqiW family bacilliredoxin
MYDPTLVKPMRDEVTRLGVQELHSPEEVEEAMSRPGTTLVFVNSVCGCAAAGARPALALSLMHKKRPENVVTVFAGMEREAVARAREFFKPYQPSSPQIALMKDGKVLKMWQRHDIEGRDPSVIAQSLAKAYDEHCK